MEALPTQEDQLDEAGVLYAQRKKDAQLAQCGNTRNDGSRFSFAYGKEINGKMYRLPYTYTPSCTRVCCEKLFALQRADEPLDVQCNNKCCTHFAPTDGCPQAPFSLADCDHTEVIDDEREGTLVCTICGFVVEDSLFLYSHRIDGPLDTIGITAKSPSIGIDIHPYRNKIGYRKHVADTYPCEFFANVCATANITERLVPEMTRAYDGLKKRRGAAQHAIMAACVYNVLLTNGATRTMKEVAHMTGDCNIRKLYQAIVKNFATACVENSDELLSRWSNEMGICGRKRERLLQHNRHVVRIAKREGWMRYSGAMAAGCVYVMNKSLELNKSTWVIKMVCNVSETTLKRYANQYFKSGGVKQL